MDAESEGARSASGQFDGYVAGMGDAPVLGHLVVYSVYDGRVTPDALELWFIELQLDRTMLPAAVRAYEAYEKTTGEVSVSYAMADPQRVRRQRQPGEKVGTLMVRHVAFEADRVTRHLVREVRNEGDKTLEYETRLAVVTFDRDLAKGSAPGAGMMRIQADAAAIGRLGAGERGRVLDVVGELERRYRYRCTFVSGDRLRAMVRGYVEGLRAVRVRPSGGVYFVGDQHAATLQGLHELVKRFGGGSNLTRIPLPDQDEMRVMIVSAWRERAADELGRLSRDIAAARRDGAGPKAIEALAQRFRRLKEVAAEHSSVLKAAVRGTQGAMDLAEVQITDLLMNGR